MFYYGIKKISFSDKRMPNLERSIESLWGRIEHLGRLFLIAVACFLFLKLIQNCQTIYLYEIVWGSDDEENTQSNIGEYRYFGFNQFNCSKRLSNVN